MQTRLLRVLQEKEVLRVGDNKPVPISVRVIVASNLPLADEMARGRFRKDLYYRLNVLGLEIPPLRRRKHEIRLLFSHFLDELCARARRTRPPIEPSVLAWLDRHDWPGNVRELQEPAERYFVWSTELGEAAGPFIEEMVESALRSGDNRGADAKGEAAQADRYDGSLSDIERRVVKAVLAEEGGNVSRAAKRLGIRPNTLKRKAQTAAADVDASPKQMTAPVRLTRARRRRRSSSTCSEVRGEVGSARNRRKSFAVSSNSSMA